MEDRKWNTPYHIIQRHEGVQKEWIGDHLDIIYRDSTSFSFRDTKTGRKVTVMGGAIEITKTETNLE